MKRMAYIDNFKGLLMVLVVLGHAIVPLKGADPTFISTALYRWLWIFHMPGFIFAAGLFAGHYYSPEKGFRADRVLNFFLLFVLFRLSMLLIINPIIGIPPSSEIFMGFFDMTSIEWFMLAMTGFVLLVPVLARLTPVQAITASVLLSLISGYLIDQVGFFSIARIINFLPFFAAGYYLTSERLTQAKEWIEAHDTKIFKTAATAFLVIIFAVCFFAPDSLTPFIHALSEGFQNYSQIAEVGSVPEWLALIGRLATIIIAALMCASVLVLMPTRHLPIFTIVGERSLQVYMLHAYAIYLISYLGLNDFMLSITPLWVLSAYVFGIFLSWLLAAPAAPAKFFGFLSKKCRGVIS
jgi:fucose 4-O-acetylase-like acetyltransferase